MTTLITSIIRIDYDIRGTSVAVDLHEIRFISFHQEKGKSVFTIAFTREGPDFVLIEEDQKNIGALWEVYMDAYTRWNNYVKFQLNRSNE